MPKLVVYMAFDRNDEGELYPVFEPKEASSEGQAISRAQKLADQHAGVIAWSREAFPDTGDYGEAVELFRSGDVPLLD